MTRLRRSRAAHLGVARGRIGLLWALLSLLLSSSSPAALSPVDLVDKATLRVDLGEHFSAITAVAAAADGRCLATAGLDRVVRLWDGKTGEFLRSLRPPSHDVGGEGRIFALAFSPDSRHLAVGGSTRFWDAAEGRGSAVYLFEVSSGRLAQRLPGSSGAAQQDVVFRLVWSRDGGRLLTLAGRNGHRFLGGARLFEPMNTAQPSPVDIAPLVFADADQDADGRTFLTHTTGFTIYESGPIPGRAGKYFPMDRLPGQRRTWSGYLHSVRVSPDGTRLAISYLERARIEIRDSRSLRLQAAVELAAQDQEELTQVLWAADSKSLIVAGQSPREKGSGGFLHRLLIEKTLRVVPLWQPAAGILAIDLLPDGGILCGSADGSWAVLEKDGSLRWQHGGNSLLPEGPSDLYTDSSGERIWLRFGPQAKHNYGFSLPTLAQESRLSFGKPPDDALHPPRIEVPASHTLSGWRRGRQVTLDSAALPTQGEESSALAIAPNGHSFVIGTSGSLQGYFFDRNTPRSGCPLPARPGSDLPNPCFDTALPARALAVNYSGDGRHLIAALGDGSIRWYGAADGKLKLSFVLHSDKRRWVLWLPQGSYAASIGGAGLVGWQVNPAQVRAATLFPLERFASKLYDPTKVAQALQAGFGRGSMAGDEPDDLPMVEGIDVVPRPGVPTPRQPPKPLADPSARAQPGDAALLRGLLPPVATILSPSDGTTVADGQVMLRVMVHSPIRQAIRAVRVLVNGRLDAKARGVVDLGGDSGPEVGAASGALPGGAAASGVEVYSVPVSLPVGSSSIAVYAEGSAGASVPAVIHIKSSAAAQKAVASRPRLVVLAVGVGEYPRADLRLAYPAKDARDLVSVLKSQGGHLYEEVAARVITDEGASLDGIRQGFDWLARSLRADDTALIFLAGHGVNEAGSGQYVFLPRDIDLSRVGQTGLSASELQRVLNSLPSRVLLFLDTCHSGNVLASRKPRGLSVEASDATGPRAGDVTRFVSDLSSVEQGIVVMAASTGRQASQESPQWQNGAFTLAVIEGLRGSADFRNTGRVTINMLDLYVSERVRELTEGAQTPATAKPVTIPDFPVVTLR